MTEVQEIDKANVGKWLIEHKTQILDESSKRGLTPNQFIVLMLEDSLEAWKNSEVLNESY